MSCTFYRPHHGKTPVLGRYKILWLAQYFGNDKQSPFYKRVTLTHDKSLAHGVGGILIDDRPYHGASQWNDEAAGADQRYFPGGFNLSNT